MNFTCSRLSFWFWFMWIWKFCSWNRAVPLHASNIILLILVEFRFCRTTLLLHKALLLGHEGNMPRVIHIPTYIYIHILSDTIFFYIKTWKFTIYNMGMYNKQTWCEKYLHDTNIKLGKKQPGNRTVKEYNYHLGFNRDTCTNVFVTAARRFEA